MNKKINVFLNGKYIYSTNAYKRCKDVLKALTGKDYIIVASAPSNKTHSILPTDKLTAFFDRGL